MHFRVRETNPSGKVISDYTDEYQLEDFYLTYNEYFTPVNWCKK